MKSLFAICLACAAFTASAQKPEDTTLLQPVELTAIRAGDRTPVAKTNLTGDQIKKNNIGQDLPFILQQTPSVLVNADAGTGIGYTGIRIRGTDASRINITFNGIPYNDAESQGTYFVDLPDIASSAGSIQIQRGVGTSTNGAGSFGGTINLSTNDIIKQRNIELNNAAGSYGTLKNTLLYNSGIFSKHFTADARLSNIQSEGYIERASSRLRSAYTSFAYIDNKSSLRLNMIFGKEKTYQAWNGIDENTLKINRRYNSAGTEKPGAPYANETDNYNQNHFQLFYNRKLNNNWAANIALFLTKGKGYYEQFKAGQLLSDYGLPAYSADTGMVSETNLIRRLWLDNSFYGTIFSLQYNGTARNILFGGSWNKYDGSHYGEIISAEIQPAVPENYRWYDVDAYKKDLAAYGKWTEHIGHNWDSYLDIQLRAVDYFIHGFEHNPSLYQANHYFFLNPKAGISYIQNKSRAYFSYSHASKEPNRDDFESGQEVPRAESMNDFELGFEKKNKFSNWAVNLYYMLYRDQLVLTGKINDVGAYTRTNIKNSYRCGIEVEGSKKIYDWLIIAGNATLSSNKIKGFTEYLDDFDNGGQQTNYYATSDLPFSPSLISSASAIFIPIKHGEISLIGKYAGRQFLDNTSRTSRSLDPYYVQNVKISYDWKMKRAGSVNIFVQINNIFSTRYEPNGYTFSYIYGNKLNTENYYFPMAPANIICGINIRL